MLNSKVRTPDILELVFRGELREIEKYIPKEILTKLYSYVPEAKRIWKNAIKIFENTEKETEIPYHLVEKSKLYALDGVVCGEILGISMEKRSAPLMAFAIYYLSVHLYDDLIEDPDKFLSKFLYLGESSPKDRIRPMCVSFALHSSIAASRAIGYLNNYSDSESQLIFIQKFMKSLAMQIKYFAKEKKVDITPEETLEIKEHCVSGEATGFLTDCFKTVYPQSDDFYADLKTILKKLGSLTQFTDDLRDYGKDRITENANLLISMEEKWGVGAKKHFAEWYLKEEQEMLSELNKAGLDKSAGLICAIPWHPFFMKHLA
jgi:hypothetical protein